MAISSHPPYSRFTGCNNRLGMYNCPSLSLSGYIGFPSWVFFPCSHPSNSSPGQPPAHQNVLDIWGELIMSGCPHCGSPLPKPSSLAFGPPSIHLARSSSSGTSFRYQGSGGALILSPNHSANDGSVASDAIRNPRLCNV
ncbi:hypothetical protein HYQ46_011261 [Verticillium longisporum]|nr:hypothetical protein HYQ46_011261 [Verticillium longisporum]